jgi:hypothetical protein
VTDVEPVDPFDKMLRACLDGLYEGERREITAHLLGRIVRICADVVDAVEGTPAPALLWIKAWTLRVGDLVWKPEPELFAGVTLIDSDSAVGVLRVAFDDDTASWYSSADTVQIPMQRAVARAWNDRRRRHGIFQGATPMTHS